MNLTRLSVVYFWWSPDTILVVKGNRIVQMPIGRYVFVWCKWVFAVVGILPKYPKNSRNARYKISDSTEIPVVITYNPQIFPCPIGDFQVWSKSSVQLHGFSLSKVSQSVGLTAFFWGVDRLAVEFQATLQPVILSLPSIIPSMILNELLNIQWLWDFCIQINQSYWILT